MVTQTKTLSRGWMLALAGCCVAFAWVLLTLVLGWGTTGAHAADGDRGGLLGGVTDTLTGTANSTVDAVANTAAATVSTVASTSVATATDVVPPAAPVVEAAVPVVQAVADTATTVAAPVTEIASSGAVAATVDPVVSTVTSAVSSVPVVGRVVSALGVEHAAAALTGTVDHTLGTAGTIVRSTPGTIAGAVQPSGNLPGVTSLLPSLSGPAPAVAAPAVPPALLVSSLVAVTLVSSMADAAASVLATLSPSFSALAIAGGAGMVSALLMGLCAPAGAFSPGSGSGLGAAALVARGPLAAHRAWVRRSGPTNDRVPPAPTASTDVSPD